VPTKTIFLGAIAALALATLTANAGTATTHRGQGSVVSLVAATAAVAKADRDAVTVGIRSPAAEATPEATTRPVISAKPATPRAIAITPGCQQAINTLKAMPAADVTEDTAERAASQPLSASGLLADRTEDTAEAQRWSTALTAARTACVPQPSTACQTAIASLQAVQQANRTEDLGEWTGLRTITWPAELTTLKTAFGAVATACADRD
jgi:hypothetical protein